MSQSESSPKNSAGLEIFIPNSSEFSSHHIFSVEAGKHYGVQFSSTAHSFSVLYGPRFSIQLKDLTLSVNQQVGLSALKHSDQALEYSGLMNYYIGYQFDATEKVSVEGRLGTRYEHRIDPINRSPKDPWEVHMGCSLQM
ncbi:MAG: hypothetical protein AB8C84_12445 [Oligoflexales bacterium]